MTSLNRFYLASFAASTYFWIAITIPYLTFRNIPLSTVLFMISAYNIVGSVLEYPTGVFGDIYGYRKSQLLGFIFLIASHLILLLPGGILLYSFGLLLLAFGISSISGNDFGLLYGLSGNQKKAIADYKFYCDMSLFVSAVAGGFLMFINPILPFVINIVVWIVGFFIMSTVPEKRIIKGEGNIFATAHQGLKAIKSSRILIGLCIFFTVVYAIGAGVKFWVGSFNVLFLLSPSIIGLIIGFGTFARGWGAKLSTKLNFSLPLRVILIIVPLFIAGVTRQIEIIIGSILLFQLFMGGILVYFDHQFQIHSPDSVRASIFSFRKLTSRLFQSIYFFLLGLLLSQYHLALVFFGSALLILMAFGLFLFFAKNRLTKAAPHRAE